MWRVRSIQEPLANDTEWPARATLCTRFVTLLNVGMASAVPAYLNVVIDPGACRKSLFASIRDVAAAPSVRRTARTSETPASCNSFAAAASIPSISVRVVDEGLAQSREPQCDPSSRHGGTI
jgi:hypothetical protein